MAVPRLRRPRGRSRLPGPLPCPPQLVRRSAADAGAAVGLLAGTAGMALAAVPYLLLVWHLLRPAAGGPHCRGVLGVVLLLARWHAAWASDARRPRLLRRRRWSRSPVHPALGRARWDSLGTSWLPSAYATAGLPMARSVSVLRWCASASWFRTLAHQPGGLSLSALDHRLRAVVARGACARCTVSAARGGWAATLRAVELRVLVGCPGLALAARGALVGSRRSFPSPPPRSEPRPWAAASHCGLLWFATAAAPSAMSARARLGREPALPGALLGTPCARSMLQL